jgi:hypothetical protein
MQEKYEQYFLEENPFPEVATLDPSSQDRKTSGEIFCEEIVGDEVRAITQKIDGRVNVVYVAGLQFDKGVGKSALVAHEWRRLKGGEFVTAPFMRCKSKQKPTDFCDGLVKIWCGEGHIWRVCGTVLSQFAEENASPSLTKQAIDLMLKTYPHPPETLPYTRYLHVMKLENLARSIGEWMHTKDPRVEPKFGSFFIEQSLSHPGEFYEDYLKLKIPGFDRIDLYKQALLCLRLGGYKYHYIFLDQFEDAVMPVSAGQLADFCLGMRRMIEANQGLGMMLVTLHPDSETKLGLPGATDLVKIAPIDNYRRVDVMALRTEGDDAISLAVAYMDAYRSGQPKYPTYPLREDVIRYVCFLEEGNIRRTLQKLHVCLKVAAQRSLPEITMDTVKGSHRDLMGTELQDDLLAKFEKFG